MPSCPKCGSDKVRFSGGTVWSLHCEACGFDASGTASFPFPRPTKPEVFSVSSGDAYCWAEQKSSVMLKAVTKSGDPVELTKEEAVALAQALLKSAEQVS